MNQSRYSSPVIEELRKLTNETSLTLISKKIPIRCDTLERISKADRITNGSTRKKLADFGVSERALDTNHEPQDIGEDTEVICLPLSFVSDLATAMTQLQMHTIPVEEMFRVSKLCTQLDMCNSDLIVGLLRG